MSAKWIAPALALLTIGYVNSASAASLGSLLGVDGSVLDVSETITETIGGTVDINLLASSTPSGGMSSGGMSTGSCGKPVMMPPSCGGGGGVGGGGGFGGCMSPTSISFAITISITIEINIDLDVDITTPPAGSACRCVCIGF